MSFGGAVSAMQTSLKNNKRERVNTFKKLKEHNFEEKENGKLYFKNKATPEELEAIRKKIKRESTKKMLMNITLLAVFCLSVLLVIGFAKF